MLLAKWYIFLTVNILIYKFKNMISVSEHQWKWSGCLRPEWKPRVHLWLAVSGMAGDQHILCDGHTYDISELR